MTPLRARLRGYKTAIACRLGYHEDVLQVEDGVMRHACLHCRSLTPGWDTLSIKPPRRALRGKRSRVLHNPKLAGAGLKCRCVDCVLERWRTRPHLTARARKVRRQRMLKTKQRQIGVRPSTGNPEGADPLSSEPQHPRAVCAAERRRTPISFAQERKRA